MAAVIQKPLEIRWNPERPIEGVHRMGEPEVPRELVDNIHRLREQLGNETVFLGHSYQRDEVIQFADKIGDSLALSQYAADEQDAKHIIFLGVHFMAETADMLTPPEIPVILPDLRAGCTMADMAQIEDVEDAWRQLDPVLDLDRLTPVTYINSSAAIKAHVGKHGGTICTSSNADAIIKWALEQNDRVMFFPDQHLGRNTCYKLGIPLDEMIVWDPEEPLGGNTRQQILDSRVILWKGHCSVHQHFQASHVDIWRQRIPDIRAVSYTHLTLPTNREV